MKNILLDKLKNTIFDLDKYSEETLKTIANEVKIDKDKLEKTIKVLHAIKRMVESYKNTPLVPRNTPGYNPDKTSLMNLIISISDQERIPSIPRKHIYEEDLINLIHLNSSIYNDHFKKIIAQAIRVEPHELKIAIETIHNTTITS